MQNRERRSTWAFQSWTIVSTALSVSRVLFCSVLFRSASDLVPSRTCWLLHSSYFVLQHALQIGVRPCPITNMLVITLIIFCFAAYSSNRRHTCGPLLFVRILHCRHVGFCWAMLVINMSVLIFISAFKLRGECRVYRMC